MIVGRVVFSRKVAKCIRGKIDCAFVELDFVLPLEVESDFCKCTTKARKRNAFTENSV